MSYQSDIQKHALTFSSHLCLVSSRSWREKKGIGLDWLKVWLYLCFKKIFIYLFFSLLRSKNKIGAAQSTFPNVRFFRTSVSILTEILFNHHFNIGKSLVLGSNHLVTSKNQMWRQCLELMIFSDSGLAPYFKARYCH